MSNVERVIPESIKQTWHDWRASMKKTEHDITGSEEISEHVEMAGWGVEEAAKANKSEASKSNPPQFQIQQPTLRWRGANEPQ